MKLAPFRSVFPSVLPSAFPRTRPSDSLGPGIGLAITQLTPSPLYRILLALVTLSVAGCWTRHDSDVVVYAALDREFSEPILQQSSEALGLQILPKYDLESTKTVGLVTRLQTEARHPQCDLFWNNEILHTLRLKQAGLLRPVPLEASDYPATFRDPEGYWYGFAARARVLIINTDLYPDANQRPQSIMDLVDPQWPTPRAIAKPLFGTTATHAAVLASIWGPEKFEQYFGQLAQIATVVSGNKQVAEGVASGEFGFGLTDTDDAIIELEKGAPVAIVFPDQHADGPGTLFIPNTLCCLKNSPNPGGANRLLQTLLQPSVEAELAQGPSAQIPLHQSIRLQSRSLPAEQVRWMDVDFEAAALQWETTAAFLMKQFQGSSN